MDAYNALQSPSSTAGSSRYANFRFPLLENQPEQICQPRELVTSEIHPANDYYGQASVLKRYAGLSLQDSLRLVVEHGINLDDIVWPFDANAPLPMIGSCSDWRAEVHRNKTAKVAVPIGFGYLYARHVVADLLGPDPSSNDRRGIIAFPCHSTHTIKARFDHFDYARRLAELSTDSNPVAICAYWKDFLDGSLQPYIDQGLMVVSCGHLYDPDFMLRFHNICRQFKTAVSNAIGTHLFQAVASGCNFHFLDSSHVVFEIPEHEKAACGQFNPRFQAAEKEARELFAYPSESISPQQQAFVDRFIGTHHRLSRPELRRLFEKAKRWDRFVPRTVRMDNGSSVWAPTAVARRFKKPLYRLQRIGHSIAKRLPGSRRAA